MRHCYFNAAVVISCLCEHTILTDALFGDREKFHNFVVEGNLKVSMCALYNTVMGTLSFFSFCFNDQITRSVSQLRLPAVFSL